MTRCRLGICTLTLAFAQACSSAGDGGGTGAGGSSGSAGTTGTVGAAGAAGTTGAAGTSGGAGTTGMGGGAGSGSSGSGGTGGAGATGGGAGRGGASGAGGRGGSTGVAGTGGVSGSGGGMAGRGGTGGSGGGNPDASVSDGPRDATSDGGATFMPCPTTPGTACAVLPLGDSITEGYLPSGANGGYRVELFRQAVRAGKNVTFVGTQQNGPTTVDSRTFPRRHEGRGGYTIAGGGQGALAGTVTDTAIAMYQPHIVLLMVGTNDINGNINVSTAPTRLGQLIDEIIADAPSALVVVASIIPIANDGSNQRIPNYNAAIPGLVATRAAAGKHVVFVDNYAAFIRDTNFRTSLMVDNLHPNAAGYDLLGRTFYDAIAALLPPGP
jgi:lysophospholipase L1-like esterase